MNKDHEAQRSLVDQLIYELPVLRARMGASQDEVAKMIGVSRQTYNAVESGKREMTWITYLALLGVFLLNDETKSILEQSGDILEKTKRLLSNGVLDNE